MEALFNIESSDACPFEETDVFNNNNVLKGYINRTANSKYGMLFITHVNGKECPQTIWTTPKLHYPMSQDGKWARFDDVKKIEVWSKIDGSNILGFIYKDADGKQFVSYKTRLRPILGESKFGNFVGLWQEILQRYPQIPDMVIKNGFNIAFELFGKRNKVLLDYDVSLDIRCLYGVKDGGKIVSPSSINLYGIQSPELIQEINPDSNFPEEYEKLKQVLEKRLIVVKTMVDGVEKTESMRGDEGAVIYVIHSDGHCSTLWKNKPSQVLDIHWANQGVPYHSIYTTILNSFEVNDEPNFQIIFEMLKEEFQESEIYKKEITIKKLIAEVIFEKKIKAELFAIYRENKLDIVGDKGGCMRFFAQRYPKTMASKIYTYLNQEFGV